MILIKNATKFYTSDNNETVRGISEFNLRLPSKGLIHIKGSSGSGKTTLLNIIAGLIDLDYGTINIDGFEYNSHTEDEIKAFRLTNISLLTQNGKLLNDFTVYYNIFVPLKFVLNNDYDCKKITHKVIDELGISHLKNKKVKTLSGGEKQKVSIAKILAHKSNIILLDEIFSSMDLDSINDIKERIIELSKDKLVIIIDHLDYIEHTSYDRIITIENGQITKDVEHNELPDDIKASTKIKSIRMLDVLNFIKFDFINRKGEYIKRLFIYLIVFLSIFIGLIFFVKIDYEVVNDDESKNVYLQKWNNQSFHIDEYNQISRLNESDYSISPFSKFKFMVRGEIFKKSILINASDYNLALVSMIIKEDLLDGRLPLEVNEVVVSQNMAEIGDTIRITLNEYQYDFEVVGITKSNVYDENAEYILVDNSFLVSDELYLKIDIFSKNFIQDYFNYKVYYFDLGYEGRLTFNETIDKNTFYVETGQSINVLDYDFIVFDKFGNQIDLDIKNVEETNNPDLIGNLYVSESDVKRLFNEQDFDKELLVRSKNRFYIDDFIYSIHNDYRVIDPFYLKLHNVNIQTGLIKIPLFIVFICVIIALTISSRFIKNNEFTRDYQVLDNLELIGIKQKHKNIYGIIQIISISILAYLVLNLMIVFTKTFFSIPHEIYRNISFVETNYILVIFITIMIFNLKKIKEKEKNDFNK